MATRRFGKPGRRVVFEYRTDEHRISNIEGGVRPGISGISAGRMNGRRNLLAL
jgi:hypothetical protein